MIKAMKDFQIPMRVEVDKDANSPVFGRFTTEADIDHLVAALPRAVAMLRGEAA